MSSFDENQNPSGVATESPRPALESSATKPYKGDEGLLRRAQKRNLVLLASRFQSEVLRQGVLLYSVGFQSQSEVSISPVTGEVYQWWERVSRHGVTDDQ